MDAHSAQPPSPQRVQKAKGIFQVGRIANPRIDESSGVVPAAKADQFWTHNDGKDSTLFLINASGESLAQFTVIAPSVGDWEDIARDEQGNLYLADVGNNFAVRKEVAVHRFAEPVAGETNGSVKADKSWRLRFPEAAFDCEAFFVWRGDGYLVSKVFNDQRAVIYRFPLESTNTTITLERVVELPVTSPVTGADLSADGATLGLVTGSGSYLFRVAGNLKRAGEVRPRFAGFREGQIEGCCFVPEGLLAVSEKRQVFLYTPAAYRDK